MQYGEYYQELCIELNYENYQSDWIEIKVSFL